MRIRQTILWLSVFLSSNLFAGTMGVIEYYDGFYLGGSLGIANLMDKESTLYATDAWDRHQFATTGISGGGILGYDFSIIPQVKLGIEGFINGTDLNIAARQYYDTQASYRVNMNYNTGIRILPGLELAPGTLAHVILGYAYGKLNIKDNGDYGYINTGISANGFQAGLGFQLPCYFSGLSIRGDLIYTTYGSRTSLGLSPSLTPQNYYNNFSTMEGNLALVYKFL